MAEAADIGANFSNYVGNAGAAGGNFGVIEIDTRPLSNLAAYTFMANKVKFDQAQRDMEANAKKLADLTAYDLTNAIPKERELIQKGYNELYNLVRDDPTVLDYKNNPDGWLRYNKKKNEFENMLQSGKVRNIMNIAREKEIAETTNVAEQKRLREELDKEISATDINTPLKHTQLFDVKPIEVSAPPNIKFDVTNEAANIIGTRVYEIADMASVDAQAGAGVLGFEKVSKDPNSSEYKAQSASGKLEPVESATIVTEVLQDQKYQNPAFRNEDGTLNIDAVIKANPNNTVLTETLSSVKQYNNKMDEMVTQIQAGYFQDKVGNQLTFGVGGLKESNYAKIDITDGLSPKELLKIRILGMAKPADYSTKFTYTGEANKKKDLGLEWFKANTARISATRPYASEGEGKAPDILSQPALIFGEHVNRLKKHFNENEGDFKINYEGTDEITRKALGLKKGKYVVYSKDGTAFVNSDKNGKGGTPLTIEQQKNNFIMAIKGGSKVEAVLDSKFLGDAEAGFQSIFKGLTSGTAIWNNWGGTPTAKKADETTTTPETKSGGMTDEQYAEFLKKNGLK